MSRENWLSDDNNFITMPIPLNGEDVSDIIKRKLLCGSRGMKHFYYNDSTGANSENIWDVVRPGKRFVICYGEYSKQTDFKHGFYIKWDKEHDILICVLCMLSENDNKYEEPNHFKWVETERMYLSRDGYKYVNQIPAVYEFTVDICGQTVVLEDGSIPNETFVSPAGSKREMISYFDGLFVNSLLCLNMCVNTLRMGSLVAKEFIAGFNVLSGYVETFNFNGNPYPIAFFGGVAQIGKDVSFIKAKNIPKAAKAALNDALAKWFDIAKETSIAGNETIEKYEVSFCIVQNIKGRMVQRIFRPVIFYESTIDKTEVVLIEYANVILDDVSKTKDNIFKRMTAVSCVWCDSNVKGTVLEHSLYMIKDVLRVFKSNLKKYDYFSAESETDAFSRKKYGIFSNGSVNAAMEVGSNNLLEIIIGLPEKEHSDEISLMDEYRRPDNRRKTIGELKKSLLYQSVTARAYTVLDHEFLSIDEEKKKLHEILKVPKSLFEYACKKDDLSLISLSKVCFRVWAYDDYKDYFMRLDKDSVHFLCDALSDDNVWKKLKQPHRFADLIACMIDLFGVESWKSYVSHLNKLTFDEFITYDNYINMLMEIPDDMRQDAQWKVSGDALSSLAESVQIIYETIKLKGYSSIVKKFNDSKKQWALWNFESGGLQIVAPDKPDDLVREGFALHHCAKDYIKTVANGGTLVLFIRSKNDLLKPYFTLEIRNNKIRQCHGFGNSIVEKDGQVYKFLKKFCKNFNIPFVIPDYSLGVRD